MDEGNTCHGMRDYRTFKGVNAMINLDLFQIFSDVDGRYGALAEVHTHSNLVVCPVCKSRKFEQEELDSPRLFVTYAQKKWPDFLGGGRTVIISERVVNDLVDNNITGFRTVKLKSYSVKPANKPAPMPYYYLIATGQALLNPVLPYENSTVVCSACGCWNLKHTLPNNIEVGCYPLKIIKWDGQDFANTFIEKTFWPCCSRKVIELAHNKQWTNFGFSLPYSGCPQIRHLKKNWAELFLTGLKKDFQARLDKFPQFNLPMPDFLLQVPDQPL